MAEEELPNELEKLEIGSILHPVKLIDAQLQLALNPFYSGNAEIAITKTPAQSGSTQVSTNQRNCHRCRFRCSSESVLDDFKTSSLELDIVVTSPRSVPGVCRPTFKKGSSAACHKFVMREPVLRALKTCYKQAPMDDKSSTKDRLSKDAMTDFRDLISECQTLLCQNGEFDGRLSQLSLSYRNTKNFTTMQASTSSKLRTHLARTKSGLEGDNAGPQSLNSIMAHITPPVAIEPTTPRASTSCSQQAGNGTATTCDDVTIDELASYFETLVHIPKKMSTMAEMMYT